MRTFATSKIFSTLPKPQENLFDQTLIDTADEIGRLISA